jgi:HEPN domain-containing protein
MTDDVRRYLRKAEHALEVAEDLLKDGHVPDAADNFITLMPAEAFL